MFEERKNNTPKQTNALKNQVPDEVKALSIILDDENIIRLANPENVTLARKLHSHHLKPEELRETIKLLDTAKKALPEIVTSAIYTGIELKYLPKWAASGIIKLQEVTPPAPQRRRRGNRAFMKPVLHNKNWATVARRYITACGGEQYWAARCAESHINPETARRMYKEGAMNEESVEAMNEMWNLAQ